MLLRSPPRPAAWGLVLPPAALICAIASVMAAVTAVRAPATTVGLKGLAVTTEVWVLYSSVYV